MKVVSITITGNDQIGVIAKVTTYLSSQTINIVNISHTILHDFFRMIIEVDMSRATVDTAILSEELKKICDAMNLEVHVREEQLTESS